MVPELEDLVRQRDAGRVENCIDYVLVLADCTLRECMAHLSLATLLLNH